MRVSYSALQIYKNCPLKFKYQVLDKIKAPKTIEAIFGNAVHSALKKIFQRTPLYPSLDEVIDFFNNKWGDVSNTLADKVDEETNKIYFEEGVSMLKNFYKKNPPWNFNVVELESRFGVIIEDHQDKENHILAGIIDRIDKDPNANTYEIIDYKTSKRMPSQDDLDKDLQLSIYNLGILKKWPHLKPENLKLSLYFLKHNEKIETKRTPADLKDTKEEILKIIHEIQDLIKNNKEFISTPSALCDWCGYKKMCPMWKHLYKEPDARNKTQEEISEIINEYFELKEQNQQNNTRIKVLQASICDFMDKEGISRVFGENGFITRIMQERTGYDMPKIKKILEKLGKWDGEIVTKKQYPVLKASKKKIN
jgi:RecB family exonuclease